MTAPTVALYDTRCELCQEQILADIDRVVEIDGAWVHAHCAEETE